MGDRQLREGETVKHELNPGQCREQNAAHKWVVDPPTQVCAHCGLHRAHPYECEHVFALAADGGARVCVRCAEVVQPISREELVKLHNELGRVLYGKTP